MVTNGHIFVNAEKKKELFFGVPPKGSDIFQHLLHLGRVDEIMPAATQTASLLASYYCTVVL